MSAYYVDELLTAENLGELLTIAHLRPDLVQRHFQEGWLIPWLRDQGRPDLAALVEQERTHPGGFQRFLAAACPGADATRG